MKEPPGRPQHVILSTTTCATSTRPGSSGTRPDQTASAVSAFTRYGPHRTFAVTGSPGRNGTPGMRTQPGATLCGSNESPRPATVTNSSGTSSSTGRSLSSTKRTSNAVSRRRGTNTTALLAYLEGATGSTSSHAT